MNIAQAREIVFLCKIYGSSNDRGTLGQARALLTKYGIDYKIIEEVAQDNEKALSELRRNESRCLSVRDLQRYGSEEDRPETVPELRRRRSAKRTVRRMR